MPSQGPAEDEIPGFLPKGKRILFSKRRREVAVAGTKQPHVHHQLRNEISEKIKSLPPEDFKQFILSLRQLSIDSVQKIADQIPMND
jgi:hypothetical protein